MFNVTKRQRRMNFGVLISFRPLRWELSAELHREVCSAAITIGPVRLAVSY